MTASLPRVFRAAGVGLHAFEPKFRPDWIIEIAQGLIEMRKAGLFRAVYIDAGIIRIAFGTSQKRSITKDEAWKVIKAFRKGGYV